MSHVMLPIQSLRGKTQLSPFDMIAPMGLDTGLSKVDTLVHGFSANNIIAPPIMTRANQNPFIFKTRGCRDLPETHIIVRRKPLDTNLGLYPQVGTFRHEKKGLAYDAEKPINGPIMPLSDSFFAGRNNALGVLR